MITGAASHETQARARRAIERLDALGCSCSAAAPLGQGADDGACSAANLEHYLAFRKRDERDLQKLLMTLGLSSLGRAEPAVLGAISLVRHAAGRLIEPPISGAEPERPALSIEKGRAILDRRTDQLLGPRPSGRVVRILVTMPTDAAFDPAFVERCLERGADAVRINTTHDDADAWFGMIEHTRSAQQRLGRHVAVFADLGGPKIRVARVLVDAKPKERTKLGVSDRFTLAPDTIGRRIDATLVTATNAQALRHLQPGEHIWINDGKLGAIVESVRNGAASMRVTSAKPGGQRIRALHGINLPETRIDLPALTDEDVSNARRLAPRVDALCLSFAHDPRDIRSLRETVRSVTDRDVGIVLKIETRRGFERLPGMLRELVEIPSRAVMIARGDLAVELGYQRLAEVQEEILWLCEAAHTPVIWATEVLASLAKTGIPARAEITDAAMGQRAECVMLNKGPEILEAIGTLSDILARMGSHQRKKMATLRPLGIAIHDQNGSTNSGTRV